LNQLTDPGKNLTESTENAVKRLAELPKELGVPLLLLCQLNRDSAKENRKPEIRDLRQSGAIEQLARQIWLLHRPGYDDKRADQHELILNIAKQTHGSTCPVELYIDLPLMFVGSKNPNYGERNGY
jgi:replicative DNA helicase